jgi:hypothetical protein
VNATYTPARTWRTVGRGLAAFARLLLTALDALITAAVGIPPIAWCARRLGGAIRAQYRLGRFGEPSTRTDLAVVVVDAEILDEEDDR